MMKNTTATYGAISKTLHWLTVLLMFTVIPLGIIAYDLPFANSEELARKAWWFSFHKTVGVTLFFVALARILWALSQPKPYPLRGLQGWQHRLAETVHWLLYASLVIVPLTGWIHHAASEGFAPIWWPIGQSLPLVPKSPGLSELFGTLHWATKNLLVLAILLHIAGALKHHIIDRDVTLKRMLPGRTDPGILPPPEPDRVPRLAAAAAYAVVIALGIGLFASRDQAEAAPELAEVASDWQVRDGTLGLSVVQLGGAVQGRFEDWTAAIRFEQTPDAEGRHGDVEVTVSIPSLTLGSVTEQALGAEFLDAAGHPTAVFTADLMAAEDGGYLADGTLRLRDTELPVQMPFTLEITDGVAQMSGAVTLQRLDFGIGAVSYPDETSLGFAVDISVTLEAVAQ